MEHLIARPRETLRKLLGFLGLEASPEYLEACRALIYKRPRRSRFEIEWTPQAQAAVERNTLRLGHLSPYIENGRLPFGVPG